MTRMRARRGRRRPYEKNVEAGKMRWRQRRRLRSRRKRMGWRGRKVEEEAKDEVEKGTKNVDIKIEEDEATSEATEKKEEEEREEFKKKPQQSIIL